MIVTATIEVTFHIPDSHLTATLNRYADQATGNLDPTLLAQDLEVEIAQYPGYRYVSQHLVVTSVKDN